MRSKKIKYFFITFMSFCSFAIIAPFVIKTADNNLSIQNSQYLSSTSKQITEIPPPTTDVTKVNTGVAVVKNGDNFILPGQYIENLTQTNNLDELKTFIQPYFYEVAKNPQNDSYLPITNNKPIFSISDVVPNNRNGNITFSVNFDKYVENAQVVNSPKSINATISGFKSIPSQTTVEINGDFNFNDFSKGDLANNPELLKQTIVVNNLPDGATYTVVPIYETIDVNPNSFEIEVTVSAYFDENVTYVQQEKVFKLTLTTAMQGLNTEIIVKQAIDKSIFPCFVTKNMISNFISITNLPKGSTVDITYDQNTNYDNKKGEISFIVTISKFFKNDVLIDGTDKPFKITITGFKKVLSSSILKVAGDFKNFKPSEINANNIVNYFDVSSFPSGVTFSGGDFLANDKEGTLTINNLTASSGFLDDEKYSLKKPYIVPTFTIDGLLTQQPTIISVKTEGDPTILADTLNELDILNNYVIIENAPPNMEININNKVVDNLRGELSFELHLSSYYNDLGILQNDYTNNFKITNFKVISASSVSLKPGLDLTNTFASQINKTNIDQYVDFISFPENAELYSYEFSNVSNLEGSLTFSFYSTSWYDENGILRPTISDEEKTKKFTIQLTGFATQQPTTIMKVDVDNSSKLASEIDTSEEVADLIEIVNPSTITNFETNWTAGNFKYNNLIGTLSFTVTVNNYFDENGIFRSVDDYDYTPLIKNFEFNNFKVINKSVVTQKAAPSEILPTDMTNDNLVNYIDTSTFPNGTIFNYDISNRINVNGTFDLVVNASQWFNDKGEFIKIPANFFITIVGCKTQKPTDVIVKQKDLSSILATEIDSISELDELIQIINPYGEIVPGETWVATNFAPLNSEGKLSVDVVINEYYDEKGNPIKKSSNNYRTLVKRITIEGFKKTEKSVLLQNSKDPSQILASEVKKNNSWEEYVDFSKFPQRKEILSSETLAFDIKGILIVNVSIKYYYNDQGNEMTDRKNFRIELKGFKQQTKVTNIIPIDNIEPDVTTYDAYSLYQTNVNQFIQKYISIVNPPPSYKVTINSIFTNNSNGSITVTVSLDNYYDEDGNIKENLSKNINIQGFKKIEKSSIVQNEYYDFSKTTAEEFKEEFLKLSSQEQINKFKEITVFNSVPINATFSAFNLEPVNNLGQLSISVIASELYDSEGNIINNQHINVVFNGFKVVDNSQLIVKNFEKDYPASDLVINQNNFWNYFDATKFPSDVIVTNIVNTYSNKNGSMNTYATFNKHFGIDGNVVNDSVTLSCEITGFKKISKKSTLIKKKNISPELLNKSPSEVILNEKNTLFNNLVDTSLFPTENIIFGIDATNFTVSNLIANNLEGTVEFNVIADKFYSGSDYNLIKQPSQFTIKVDGFLKTPPSTIKISSNKLPSEITYDDLVFVNFPTIPTPEQVSFGMVNDQNGFIEIIIDGVSYYNNDGILLYNKVFKYTTNISVAKTDNNLSLILGLSLGLGITLLIVIGMFIWWRWYKKTHEI